jgi:iron complex transport system substrate-binding protein
MPYKQETVARILEQPVSFLGMNPRTIKDVYADVRLLGGITGHAAQAEGIVRKMKKEFAEIERKARKNKRKLRMYCEAWPNPRISSPPWVAEIARICGGEMVVPAGERVTEEQVASGGPEVIVLAWAATGDKAKPEKAYQVQAWKELPAIRGQQVYVVRDELLNTPGPPLMKGARELARIISSVAMQKERA